MLSPGYTHLLSYLSSSVSTAEEKEMKRLLAALTLALLVSFAVGAGVAYADHGTDYARGNVDQGTQEVRFSASSNFNGTEARGTVRFLFRNNDPDLVVTGEVTCLTVVDDQFEAHGIVTDVRGGTTGANQFLIRGSDSGKFDTTPDTFSGFTFFSLTLPTCPTIPTPAGPVTDGEVIVHDSF
jgi:hypothetical protein